MTLGLNLMANQERDDLEEYREKCEAIIDWAEDRDDFDTDFVVSVMDQIDERDFITEAQKQGIDNIINRFGI